MQNKKQLVVIILGPPGAGKGTQGVLIADKMNLYYFETSRIIEANVMQDKEDDYVIIDGEKYPFTKEREQWQKGILNTPAVVAFWVKDKIKDLRDEGKGIVFAGSPRTLYEGQQIIPLIKDLYGKENIRVVLLDIIPEQTIWRNSRRRLCQLMRHPILSTRDEFLALHHCPLDGSELVKRKGLDDSEVIKVRLQEYRERTLPLIKYFEEEDLAVAKIDGSQTVEEVHQYILRAIS